jgi:hypothetical protein
MGRSCEQKNVLKGNKKKAMIQLHPAGKESSDNPPGMQGVAP